MSSTIKENLRIKNRSSSFTTSVGSSTNSSSGGRQPQYHHHHHKASGTALLLKTRNSKIYFSDSDDDTGQQQQQQQQTNTTATTTRTTDDNNKLSILQLQPQSNSSATAAIRKSTHRHSQSRPATTNEGTAATQLNENNYSSNSNSDNDTNIVASLKPSINRNKNQANHRRNMIIYYGREFICVLALILTTYATFQNVPPKISKVAPPKPFFPKGSLVHDYPGGHLDHVQNRVSLSELSLVMFYAPWCAESQYARATYEYVARLFYREAHFAAINCWQPGGECRHQYAKILEWPVVMAYLQNGLAVPYNGKWTRSAVTKFVTALIRPIKRVSKTEELLDLMTIHDAVVVAFVDVNRQVGNYRAFYQTAVRWLEKDPFQNVGFAVVTGASAKVFGVDGPMVRTYLWNGTMEYKKDIWSQPELHKWITSKIIRVSMWVSPPGTKSNTFAQYLKNGPVVMLFTPRNFQTESVDAYTMLRQIGMEYYNCPSLNQEWIKEMSRLYITEYRTMNRENYQEFLQQCENLIAKTDTVAATDSRRKCHYQQSNQRAVSISFGNIVNSSKLSSDYCPIGPRNAHEAYVQSACFPDKYAKTGETCAIVPKSLVNNADEDQFEGMVHHPISMLKTDYDSRSSSNLHKVAKRKKCELHFAAHPDDAPVLFFDRETSVANYDKILGLSCKANLTLTLVAVDSTVYFTFAERLGIDVRRFEDKSVAVILDHENESTYSMKEVLNSDNLIDFVYNFTTRKLTRHLKADATVGQSESNNNLIQNHHSSPSVDGGSNKIFKRIGIREINSNNFGENVMLSNKTVVVLFYSVQCALCSLLSQSVLMTSKILSNLTDIDFVRIDGDRNDLPWQYTMEKFPSLILFPANRKSESRIFPSTLEVNVQNILGFVLANLDRPHRLHALVLVCKNIKKLFPIEDCLAVLRKDIIDNISFSLRQWRKIPYKRGQILRRLQVLQRFYLHLFRIDQSCDFNSLDVFVRDIAKVWTT